MQHKECVPGKDNCVPWIPCTEEAEVGSLVDGDSVVPTKPLNQEYHPPAPVCSSGFSRYVPPPDPENPAPATPLEADRSLPSKTIVLVRIHLHVPPRPA